MKRAHSAITKALGGVKTTAAAVAASFALPSDFPPLRMRNEYSTEETALFHVFEEHKPWGVGGVGGTNEQLRDDTHMEMIFQDVLRNRITYVRNTNNQTATYNWCFGRSAQTGTDNTSFTVGTGATEEAVPTHANASNVFRPHGDILFAESDDLHTGMWVDTGPNVGSSLTVTVSPNPTAATGRVVFLRYTDNRWIEAIIVPFAIGVGTYGLTLSAFTTGIYTFRIENAPNTLQVSCAQVMTCGCWGHLPAPYIVLNANSLESVRTLGHSILVKNTAAPLNQQGYITGVQPGKGRFYGSFLCYDTSSDIYAPVRDYAGCSQSRPLATGLYGFIKPTEEQDVAFRTPFTVQSAAGALTPYWTQARTPIMKTEFVVVVMQCTTVAGRDLLVRTDQSGEIETGNQFLMVDKPRAEPSEWRDGMEALASFQQFYENPTHWKKILSTIGSIASVGGRIISLFGPEGKAAGVPISMAGDIMRGGFQ